MSETTERPAVAGQVPAVSAPQTEHLPVIAPGVTGDLDLGGGRRWVTDLIGHGPEWMGLLMAARGPAVIQPQDIADTTEYERLIREHPTSYRGLKYVTPWLPVCGYYAEERIMESGPPGEVVEFAALMLVCTDRRVVKTCGPNAQRDWVMACYVWGHGPWQPPLQVRVTGWQGKHPSPYHRLEFREPASQPVARRQK